MTCTFHSIDFYTKLIYNKILNMFPIKLSFMGNISAFIYYYCIYWIYVGSGSYRKIYCGWGIQKT